MDLITITRNLVNSIRANMQEYKEQSQAKGKAKARHSHAINVVVKTTLPENAAALNIWLSYTKNP
jgi:hypothetical protein